MDASMGLFAAGIGVSVAALGAGLGIGRLAAAAMDGIARQPSAAKDIRGAMMLPMVFVEATVLFTLVMGIMIWTK